MREGSVRLPTAGKLEQSVLKAPKSLGGVASNQQIEEFVTAIRTD
jgi:hypothetical protein